MEWQFQIARDREGLYLWRLYNPAGTTVVENSHRYKTASAAKRAAKRTGKQIASASIVSATDS
jgi:uncharacterized protein YegP (UPF0339 family)